MLPELFCLFSRVAIPFPANDAQETRDILAGIVCASLETRCMRLMIGISALTPFSTKALGSNSKLDLRQIDERGL